MYFGIDRRKIAGFLAAFFLLLISYFLLFYNTNEMVKQSKLVDHTNIVITNLEYLVSELKEAESDFKGYIIIDKDSLKEKFYISSSRVDSFYTYIRNLTIDSKDQQHRMDTLRQTLDYRFSVMKKQMSFFESNKASRDSILKAYYFDPRLGIVRKTVKRLQYYENALLKQRTEELQSFSTSVKVINITALILAFVTIIYSVGTYARENKARQVADGNAERYKHELERKLSELEIANNELTQLKTIEKFASSGRIARTIAHEVRNPLTNIGLAVEQLKDAGTQNDDTEMLLAMISRNGERINKLISDLLNATKFSELKFQKIAIHKLIDETLELSKDRIDLNAISVIKNYAAGDSCTVEVDEEKIKIAFLNIIVNAIEAMENDKGVLTVSTEGVNKKCRIIFNDNGMGMNTETLSKLFDPFFTNKEKGTGLGLTNTQNIILNHKGKIEVESKPGAGTSFIITLDAV